MQTKTRKGRVQEKTAWFKFVLTCQNLYVLVSGDGETGVLPSSIGGALTGFSHLADTVVFTRTMHGLANQLHLTIP
jgi:hypothetical protein